MRTAPRREKLPSMEDATQRPTPGGPIRLTLELQAGSTPLSGTVEWLDGHREFVGLLDLMSLMEELSARKAAASERGEE